ncbi:MAG TPA: proprotein convertase P-domain-containing protein, partial [Allocoleopsis sp.]
TQVITQGNYTEIPIPDDEPTGIFSVIKLPDQGTIKELKIRVTIEHEFLGDLEISLRSPNEQIVLLQNRTLGTRTNLDYEYNLANTPSLQQLIKQPIQGDWLLWVVDYAKEDTGMLKGWELEFKI